MEKKENEIYQVGSLANQVISTRSNPQRKRVYLECGISPTLNTMQGGGLQPFIVTEKGVSHDKFHR